ncbi:MAG TPA: hypothetical protein PKD73_18905, partial [Burkholderiaceae bacterium]|nr:hypothetical protein [Burkholderiaceae bacterium]
SQLYTSVAVDLPALQAPDRTLTPTWLDLLLETESRSLVAAGHFEEAWSLMQQSGLSFARTPEDYPRAALVAYLRAYIAHGCDLAGIGAFLA